MIDIPPIPDFLDRRPGPAKMADAKARDAASRAVTTASGAALGAALGADRRVEAEGRPPPEPTALPSPTAAPAAPAEAEIAFHSAAEIFPMMGPDDLAALAADIAAHGLREPIWRHRDGRIVDGRNRLLACRLAKMPPAFRTYEGAEASLIVFVVSLNLRRRHLNESQRAMVAAKIASLGHGGDRRSDQAANLPLETQSAAAGMLNVAARSVRTAKVVHKHGTPELVAAVERGEASVAAAIAHLPQDEQRQIVAKGAPEIRAAAKTARQDKPKTTPPPKFDDVLDRAAKSVSAGDANENVLARFDAYPWDLATTKERAELVRHALAIVRGNLRIAVASDTRDGAGTIDTACEDFDALIAAATETVIAMLDGWDGLGAEETTASAVPHITLPARRRGLG